MMHLGASAPADASSSVARQSRPGGNSTAPPIGRYPAGMTDRIELALPGDTCAKTEVPAGSRPSAAAASVRPSPPPRGGSATSNDTPSGLPRRGPGGPGLVDPASPRREHRAGTCGRGRPADGPPSARARAAGPAPRRSRRRRTRRRWRRCPHAACQPTCSRSGLPTVRTGRRRQLAVHLLCSTGAQTRK